MLAQHAPQLGGLGVNSVGQRFINEDVYPGLVGQAALFKHNLQAWVILDEQAYEEVPVDERWGVQPHFVAETVEELEREIGMPEGALCSTVGEYNRFAELGEDPCFHKSSRWLRPCGHRSRPSTSAAAWRRRSTATAGPAVAVPRCSPSAACAPPSTAPSSAVGPASPPRASSAA